MKEENKDENKVKIRIWSRNAEGSKVGHVSLETKGRYVSFWPYIDTKIDGAYESAEYVVAKNDKSYLRTKKYDKEVGEQRKRDYKGCLYHLDVEKINKTFDEFIKSNFCWTRFASTGSAANLIQAWRNREGASLDGKSNCVLLVLCLLKAGGIEENFTLFNCFLRAGIRDGVIGFFVGLGFGYLFTLTNPPPPPPSPPKVNRLQYSSKLKELMLDKQGTSYSSSNLFKPTVKGQAKIESPKCAITLATFIITMLSEVGACGFIIACLRSTPIISGFIGALTGGLIGTVLDYTSAFDFLCLTPDDMKRLITDVEAIEKGHSRIVLNSFSMLPDDIKRFISDIRKGIREGIRMIEHKALPAISHSLTFFSHKPPNKVSSNGNDQVLSNEENVIEYVMSRGPGFRL